MPIKLSEHQRKAMFIVAGTSGVQRKTKRCAHIGKRTWHALEKKGVVERSPSNDGYMHWRLTPYGWKKLKEIHAERKRDVAG